MQNILTKIVEVKRVALLDGSYYLWSVRVCSRKFYACLNVEPKVKTPRALTLMAGEKIIDIKFDALHNLERRVRYWLPRLARMANPLPVYWAEDSRDCDHVRATYAHKSPTGWQYLRDVDHLYYWAEGPTFHWRISRKEYEQFQGTWRDYGSEAHENGHRHYCDY